MRLQKTKKLLTLWERALNDGANMILMRHAPKAGSNESGLSEEGRRLAVKYGDILRKVLPPDLTLACTSKSRTEQTLKCLFPFSGESVYTKPQRLEVNEVSDFVQKQVDEIHRKIGRFRGYLPNHTYYFLERLGGEFDEGDNIKTTAMRMALGIYLLNISDYTKPIIYCGHSPAIESCCEEMLGLTILELGGFLNPLDSIHLKITYFETKWVARINPIIGYIDLENETYF